MFVFMQLVGIFKQSEFLCTIQRISFDCSARGPLRTQIMEDEEAKLTREMMKKSLHQTQSDTV